MSVAHEPAIEIERLVAEVDRVLSVEVDAIENDRRGALPRRLLDATRALGLFGISIPSEHGGLGLDLVHTCRLVAAIARHDRSLATCVGLHAGLGATPLVSLGTDAQRATWLPKLASGETIASFAATEVGAGSDLSSIAASFEAHGGGFSTESAGSGADFSTESAGSAADFSTESAGSAASFVVRGEKQYVTNGALAGLVTVLARERGSRGGYALLAVPLPQAEVQIGAEEKKLGLRASSTTSLGFEDARGERLGAPGGGLHHAYEALAVGRTVLSAGCVGTARRALDATLAHVTHRRQFRRTIGEFGASRAHVSAMAARLFAMEALVDHVAGRDHGALGSPSVVAKVFCSEAANEITDRALQLHGAMGVLEDVGIALLARDCRVTRIFEGANDVLLVHLGSEVLARGEVPRWHTTGHRSDDALAERWEVAAEVLVTVRQRVKESLGVRAVERQDCLQALARAYVGLAAASCAIARAHVDADLAEHAASTAIDEALTQLAKLQRGDARVEVERAITDDLYARGRHWVWPSTAARTPRKIPLA